MINLVCCFSLLRWSWTMRPSSLKASLMSRTRSRSRVLFANLRPFSRSAFISTGRSSSSSSSTLMKSQWYEEGRKQQYGYSSLKMTCQLWRAINFPIKFNTTRKEVTQWELPIMLQSLATLGFGPSKAPRASLVSTKAFVMGKGKLQCDTLVRAYQDDRENSPHQNDQTPTSAF